MGSETLSENLNSQLISEIRRKVNQQRKQLSAGEVVTLSQRVCSRFLESFDFNKNQFSGLTVGLYKSFQSELDLSSLVPHFQKLGWKFCYPRISIKNSQWIEFVEVPASDTTGLSWKISPYGFQEPHSELKAIDPNQLDMIFIPGVAFGEEGQRIGRGAGHYDRYLPQAPSALRVALAYDFQVIPNVIQKSWDQPMQWIVTESREWKSPYFQRWLENK